MRPLALLILVAFLLLGTVVAAEEKAAKKDSDKLQGTWNFIALEDGGKKFPEGELHKMNMIFEGDKMRLEKDGKANKEFTFKLDASKTPKTADFTDGKGDLHLAIYKLDGDTLLICVNTEKGGERPTAFASHAGTRVGLGSLKRVKK